MSSKKILESMSKNNFTTTNRKTILLLAVCLLVVLGIWWGMSFFKKSLFTVMKVPNFELLDQNNQKISNKDLIGKVYLVEFFFSKCPTICPVMNSNMKFIQDNINNKDFEIVSISIDPENDTPAVLKAHADKLGVKSSNWHFVTGNRTYIDKLASEFNIYVGNQEDKGESLNHSGMIALVDKEGNIRCRFDDKNMPILYYSGLNYQDKEGNVPMLLGKFHPDREFLLEDIKKLLQ